jgi:two-component system sensor histidine kinase KdpD
LRELALRQTAYEVEQRHGVASGSSAPAAEAGHPAHLTQDKQAPPEIILVYLTADPAAAALIRRAKRVADFFHAGCWAVAVCDGLENLAPAEREALEKHLNFARNLHLETRLLEGTDAAQELIKFARDRGVTQVYLGRPRQGNWTSPFSRDLVKQVVRLAQDLELTIVSSRQVA